jgi:hypothetical protein
MAEDSGAFKTNPVNSGRISAFFGDRAAALPRSLTVKKTFSSTPWTAHSVDF